MTRDSWKRAVATAMTLISEEIEKGEMVGTGNGYTEGLRAASRTLSACVGLEMRGSGALAEKEILGEIAKGFQWLLELEQE